MKREERIYNAISEHYERKGKELVDISYSIVNEMWTISITERYVAHGNITKLRVIDERMTNEQVDRLVNRDVIEDINAEHIRYIIQCLDKEIVRYEDVINTLHDNNITGQPIQTILNKIEYIDDIIDRLEREL